jgi:hypothetical protein
MKARRTKRDKIKDFSLFKLSARDSDKPADWEEKNQNLSLKNLKVNQYCLSGDSGGGGSLL